MKPSFSGLPSIILQKTIFCILLFLCLFFQKGKTQEVNPVPKAIHYTLLHEVVVVEFDFLEKKSLGNKKVMFDHVVFDIVQEITLDNKIVKVVKPVSFIKKKQKSSEKDLEKAGLEDSTKVVELEKYYYVSTDDLKDNQLVYTPKTWEMRAGIVTIPVKFYLPKDGRPLDFSSRSVSLGTSVGVGQQISQSKQNLWINYLFGAHFTMVTPTQDDFLNFSNNDASDDTLSAFSLSLGVTLNFEGIELGVFLGQDFLPGSAAEQWIHNGETWFSIGVGTSFLGKKNVDKPSNN